MEQDDDPYDVLLVSRSATVAEIRRSFQDLARKCHPDKLGGSVTSEAERTAATEQFQKISKAYDTLRNAELRHQFDTAAKAAELTQQWPLSATVDLDAMDYTSSLGTYSSPCRCGGSYTLTEGDLEDGVDTVCCSSCTLSIRVLYQELEEEAREEEEEEEEEEMEKEH